jgi:predicted Holliday junction resolvase-like endonuclease
MIVLIILPLVVLLGGVYYFSRVKILELTNEIENLKQEFEKERAEIRRDAKKRSGAVQWGKTIEHFVPFMSDFPVPAEDVVFLGMPIDYVGFTDTASKTKCSVHFVEVKSGNSFLMGKQKNIKKAIQEGRVHWHEIAVDGNKVK